MSKLLFQGSITVFPVFLFQITLDQHDATALGQKEGYQRNFSYYYEIINLIILK